MMVFECCTLYSKWVLTDISTSKEAKNHLLISNIKHIQTLIILF